MLVLPNHPPFFPNMWCSSLFMFKILSSTTFKNKVLPLCCMAKLVCGTCKAPVANLAGSARFLCPQCSKVEIVRCATCRRNAAKYSCPDCGFEGPN